VRPIPTCPGVQRVLKDSTRCSWFFCRFYESRKKSSNGEGFPGLAANLWRAAGPGFAHRSAGWAYRQTCARKLFRAGGQDRAPPGAGDRLAPLPKGTGKELLLLSADLAKKWLPKRLLAFHARIN